MTDFFPISSMIIIFDEPALVYRLRRIISWHKSRIVIDIPAYIYIFAWKKVKQESIRNCWVHVGLLDRIDEESFTQDENYEINNDIYNKCNIDIDDRLTLEEFTSVDDISEIFEIDSITEIIDSLTNNNKDSDDTQ